jgi:hypothetical protein
MALDLTIGYHRHGTPSTNFKGMDVALYEGFNGGVNSRVLKWVPMKTLQLCDKKLLDI